MSDPTYGDMQERIAGELMAGGRSDLNAQVKSAIQTSIRHYRASPFWFNRNDEAVTGATVSGQHALTVPAPILIVEAIRIDHGSGFFPLDRKELQILQRKRDGSQSNGKPFCWAVSGSAIWVWQTPDDAYDLEFYGVVELDALVDDEDSNAWMVEAEELIRQRARAVVQIDVLKDADARQEMQAVKMLGGVGRRCLSLLERDALLALRSENAKRSSTGRIQPG